METSQPKTIVPRIILFAYYAMRILERVQAFLPLLTIEIFLIFPPS